MFLMAQNKEKIFNLTVEGISYNEHRDRKGNVEHEVVAEYGTMERAAVYESKEDCIFVIYAVGKAIEQGTRFIELPSIEEVQRAREAIKACMNAGEKMADGVTEFLKYLFSED